MRAVLLATGYNPKLKPLVYECPSSLLKVVDKTVLQHAIEYLLSRGVKEFDFILSHRPEMVEMQMGNGSRWGVKFNYHLVKNTERPFSTLIPSMESWTDEYVILGTCDVIPELPDSFSLSTLFYSEEKWTGWGYVSKKELSELPPNIAYNELCEKLTAEKQLKAKPLLKIETLLDLKRENVEAVKAEKPLLEPPATAKRNANGIWISRATTIDPSARLIPPVYIGEYCQIGPHTRIGPSAVIENHCVIDRGSVIENSLVCQRSYVGEKLEVVNSIIDRSTVINLSHESHAVIEDSFILSELNLKPPMKWLQRFLSYSAAVALITLFSPLFIYLYFTRKIVTFDVIKIPTSIYPSNWKTCSLYLFQPEKWELSVGIPDGFLCRLPLLFNILKGDLHFTGLPPRTIEEVHHLHDDWKRLYLHSQMGMITLADVELENFPTKEEEFTSEAYYAAHSGCFYNLSLCFRWVKKRWKERISQYF